MAGFSRAFDFLRRIAGAPRRPLPDQPTGFFGECPRCGRCFDSRVRECPVDGSPVGRGTFIPLVLERRYRFDCLLGYGGMGSVYRGTDLLSDRPIAIKVIRHVLRDTAAEVRLLREAGTLARLHHPSIVAIYDYGSLPDRSPYLVMELVVGDDLRRRLASEGRIEPRRASAILAAVCAAMGAAHDEGVLHCDLKPENVLLPDEGVEAKVLDFGVARAIGASAGIRVSRDQSVAAQHRSGTEARPPEWSGALGGPREGRREGAPGDAVPRTIDEPVVGTPAYMAPELLRGESPDERTDVFSIGVIAYEMLIGDLPFGGGSVAEVALAQARGLPPAIETLPAALSRAVHAALALDADRRPPTPQALAYLIGAATGGL